MSEVKRYDMAEYGGGMDVIFEGDFVFFEDFDRVTAERDAALAELKRYQSLFNQAQKAIDRLNELHRKRIDALQQRLTEADDRADSAIAFVTRLIECAGGQPSIATGYLRDILDALKPAEGDGDEI